MTVLVHRNHGGGIDLVGAFELHFLEIAGWQATELLHGIDHGIGAELGQLLATVIVLQELFCLVRDLHEALRFLDSNADGAVTSDGLQILRAHDRTHARAAGGAMQVVDDAGIEHAALTRRADRGDLE